MKNTTAASDLLQGVHVVLARPSEPQNVGAACRALKSCGISRLTIVTDRPVDVERARPLAVSAADLLETATVVQGPDTLAGLRAAVAGSTLVAGITRRVGRKRKTVSFSPRQLAQRAIDVAAQSGGVASETTTTLVFGNEQSGLSDQELAVCQIAVSIATAPECPSLNLSHAVQVVAYEIYQAAIAQIGIEPGSSPRERGFVYTPISVEQLAETVAAITSALEAMGHPVQPGPQGMAAFLTGILGRSVLSATEADRLRKLFSKLAGMHGRG